MRINADFDRPVVLHTDDIPWQSSPMPGVSRRPLDRIGDEVARATTIVRYDPGSVFSAHVHDGGEEFIVLEGVFEDEHGAFPAGSYIRNPPTSRHTPGSAEGCVIFVKLWQFDPADRTQVRIDTTKLEAVPDPARPGVAVSPLFRDNREDVRIETWDANVAATVDAPGGLELLVLEGSLQAGTETLGRHSWIRLPDGRSADMRSGEDGARVWIKTGHLLHVTAPAV